VRLTVPAPATLPTAEVPAPPTLAAPDYIHERQAIRGVVPTSRGRNVRKTRLTVAAVATDAPPEVTVLATPPTPLVTVLATPPPTDVAAETTDPAPPVKHGGEY
jgi:hypothetical protein